MIILAAYLDKMRLEVGADLGEDRARRVDGIAIEGHVRLFRHKNQMDVHLETAVSTLSNTVIIAHRPSV